MRELGETSDPLALIPGSVTEINDTAVAWRNQAETANDVASVLRALPTPSGWEGEAADGFAQRREQVATRWDSIHTVLASAATALESFATTLGWAQQKAGDAIALWAAAEAETARSIENHRETERKAGPTGIIPPFVDGGASSRSDARNLLGYARDEVRSAGDSAAATLRAATAPDGIVWQALGPMFLMNAGMLLKTHWDSFAAIVNGTASVGNALLRNPDALLAILGGAGMMLGGGSVALGGGAVSATGIGAIGGAPAVAGGLAVAGAGAAAVGAGATKIAADALGAGGVMLIEKQKGVDTGGGRDDYGHFAPRPGSRPWVDKEKQGLDEVEVSRGVSIERDRVRADVDGGNPNGRFYDGLIRNDDGTYTAIEVKSGGATRTADQRAFDELVNEGVPASARLHGEPIRIVAVILKEVP